VAKLKKCKRYIQTKKKALGFLNADFIWKECDHMSCSIFGDALLIPPVSLCSVTNYQGNMEKMNTLVNSELTNNPAILKLIGYNNLELMYENHGYHVRFMYTVFHLNAYELLASVIIWVYRSYHRRGFSYEYFSVELSAWQRAASTSLTPEAAAEINRVYQWMIDHHDDFMAFAESPDYQTIPFVSVCTR